MKRVLSLMLILLMAFSACGEALEYTAEVYVRQGGGTLHLRAAQTTQSESLGIVKHGDEVLVLWYGEEWSNIYVPRLDQGGYIKSKYLINLEGIATEANDMVTYFVDPVFGSGAAYEAPAEVMVDLDGDGNGERLMLEPFAQPGEMERTTLSLYTDEGLAQQLLLDIAWNASISFVKLDDSGASYVFVTGDECSDDYVTYAFRPVGKTLESVNFVQPAPFDTDGVASGCLTSIEDGILRIVAHIDIVGTWNATMHYALSDGVFQNTQNGVWQLEHDVNDAEIWETRALTLKRTMNAQANGQTQALPAGTRVLVTAIDEENDLVYFVTASGLEGAFHFTRAEDAWNKYFDGIPEDECFDNLFYAG